MACELTAAVALLPGYRTSHPLLPRALYQHVPTKVQTKRVGVAYSALLFTSAVVEMETAMVAFNARR